MLSFLRQHFLDLPIHASTQMTVTNVLGAKFLEEQGVERVVTSRELQLEEVREITEQTNLEVEVSYMEHSAIAIQGSVCTAV